MNKTMILWIAAGLIITSCKPSPEGTKVTTSEQKEKTTASSGNELRADLASSLVEWTGAKPTGQHNGTVKLKNGQITLSGEEITGGSFEMDLNSIAVLDLTDPGMNAKLTGHLKSEDFFEVTRFPVATFEITSVSKITSGDPSAAGMSHRVTGNLKMKDVVRSISFNARIRIENNRVTAVSENFVIDRTEWNVRYKSKKIFADLKDQFINDEIGLKITLVAGV